jgi:hypothetical protein
MIESLLPDTPAVVAEVADPLSEKGTCVVLVQLAGHVNVQLVNLLLFASFHKWQANA